MNNKFVVCLRIIMRGVDKAVEVIAGVFSDEEGAEACMSKIVDSFSGQEYDKEKPSAKQIKIETESMIVAVKEYDFLGYACTIEEVEDGYEPE